MTENIAAANVALDAEVELEAADTSFTYGEPRALALDAEVELEVAETSFTYGEPRF
ncbi:MULTISPECIES: hypothetical protein [unclassified Kitasatospora]|uniref:hypothetical protein n=1 Tax=unclassified Kitasatospora TaxID=2633591 RepID=UPI000A850CDA|nr:MULTISPECIES: hypothetical protein [unclassified Kitasatospora]